MFGFMIGLIIGGAVGVAVMCICTVGSDADKQYNPNAK